jgi:8-oxo-dGTP pyrophosphatase MutT (NUDIX family)
VSLEVAAAIIFDPNGRVFVQRRSPERKLLANCWDIVGGHLEPGETPEQCMRRELAEETGWEIDTIHGQLETVRWMGDDGVERVETDYLVSVRGDLNAPRLEPGKHTEWRWITASELTLIDQDGRLGDKLIREIVEVGFAHAVTLGLVPPQTADVSVSRFAAVITPVIERLFFRVMLDSRPEARALIEKHGLTTPTPLIDYRMILPDRPLTPFDRDIINRYAAPSGLHQSFVDYQSTGAVVVSEDGTVTATPAGKAFYAGLWAVHDAVAGKRLRHIALLDRVVAAVSGGPAFSAVYPSYLPEGASAGLLTFTQLTALRYQRADAHAAAWAAHGLTASEMVALEDADLKQSIEDDTNRRAGLPYGALTPQERFDLLADLARL